MIGSRRSASVIIWVNAALATTRLTGNCDGQAESLMPLAEGNGNVAGKCSQSAGLPPIVIHTTSPYLLSLLSPVVLPQTPTCTATMRQFKILSVSHKISQWNDLSLMKTYKRLIYIVNMHIVRAQRTQNETHTLAMPDAQPLGCRSLSRLRALV